ncbi:MAG: hypothetical protein H7144_18135 [Burkholderiales bacterium]|nr:hypothetical protein [Phycisphaerae bacterium]
MEHSPAANKPVIDYREPPAPASSAITLRMVVFLAVFGLIIGWIGVQSYSALYQHVEVASVDGVDYYKVNLKAMSTFPFDQRYGTIDDVPKDYRALHGKKVILVGEMWAPQAASAEVENFDLVYSIAKCCFSGPPQIQHFIKSTSTKGALPFYGGPVRVKGQLSVEVVKDRDGKITSVYSLAVESLEPV